MQACGELPEGNPLKAYGFYTDFPLLESGLRARATECGLPASTVTLTPPAPNTCDGAFTRLMVFVMYACVREEVWRALEAF